jgi:hypothetical protein
MIKTIMKYKYLLAIALPFAIVLVLFIKISRLSTQGCKEGQGCKQGLENGFYHCDNFCGPKAECAITREQCVADIDCSNCNNNNKNNNNVNEGFSNNINTINTMNANMYDSMETSSLTTDTSTFATVIENNALVPKMYLGPDLWTKSFNYGLGLSENKLQYDVKRRPNKYKNMPKYQVTETATGMFYDTGPIAANAGKF